MKNRKTLIALLAVGLFIYSVYTFVGFIKKRQQTKQWTIEQKHLMVLDCIKSSKFLSTTDSTIGKEICWCAIEKLVNKYTYDEIWKLNEQAKENKAKVASLFEPLMQQCMEPYLKDIKNQKDIDDCVSRSTKNNKMTKEQSYKYCSCFLTYLKNKYSDQELVFVDSIMKVEMIKAKECFDNAVK